MENEYAIVLTATGTRDSAEKIAHALVERRLAVCVNIVPGVQSIYRWQGKIEHAQECLLLIKTRAKLFAQVQATIKELHPYELPECVMVEMTQGSEGYLRWIGENTGVR